MHVVKIAAEAFGAIIFIAFVVIALIVVAVETSGDRNPFE